MADHLSDLQLDEVAAQLRPPPDHLSACQSCSERLDSLKQSRRAAIASPGYARTLRALEFGRVERRHPARMLFFGAPALAGALALALVVLGRAPTPAPEGGDRIKGSPSLELRLAGGETAESFAPGERVVLIARGAGLDELLVLAGTDGELVQLWPTEGAASGALPSEGAVRLEPAFEVTPGDLSLHAVFSAEPLAVERARALVKAAAGEPGSVTRLGSGEVLVRRQLRVREGSRR